MKFFFQAENSSNDVLDIFLFVVSWYNNNTIRHEFCSLVFSSTNIGIISKSVTVRVII